MPLHRSRSGRSGPLSAEPQHREPFSAGPFRQKTASSSSTTPGRKGRQYGENQPPENVNIVRGTGLESASPAVHKAASKKMQGNLGSPALPPIPPSAKPSPAAPPHASGVFFDSGAKRKLSWEAQSAGGTEVPASPAQMAAASSVIETLVADSGVKVIVRARPLTHKEEQEEGVEALRISPQTISLAQQTFTFDAVAGPDSSQHDLFNMVGIPMVDNCFAGFNSSIFAYGQTGSGKTYTMWGTTQDPSTNIPLNENRGIAPRLFEQLFARIQQEETRHAADQLQYQCRCSFLEIYNEQITDLLEPSQKNLQIREDTKTGVYVENLTEEYVSGVNDITQLLLKGLANRRVGSTMMNSESSRSHSVFTCVIECRFKSLAQGVSSIRSSRMNLVDLAGSERQKQTGAAGERLKEAGNINRSLSQLGNVINILAEVAQSGKQRHIPYRDSRLTFLLQESLGGNAKLAMICAISIANSCRSETLSTLRFAKRAKAIQNKAVVNEETANDVKLLREQIRQLKEELMRMKSNGAQQPSGWNPRRSYNLLRMSLNHPMVFPKGDMDPTDSDEEMEIENDSLDDITEMVGASNAGLAEASEAHANGDEVCAYSTDSEMVVDMDCTIQESVCQQHPSLSDIRILEHICEATPDTSPIKRDSTSNHEVGRSSESGHVNMGSAIQEPGWQEDGSRNSACQVVEHISTTASETVPIERHAKFTDGFARSTESDRIVSMVSASQEPGSQENGSTSSAQILELVNTTASGTGVSERDDDEFSPSIESGQVMNMLDIFQEPGCQEEGTAISVFQVLEHVLTATADTRPIQGDTKCSDDFAGYIKSAEVVNVISAIQEPSCQVDGRTIVAQEVSDNTTASHTGPILAETNVNEVCAQSAEAGYIVNPISLIQNPKWQEQESTSNKVQEPPLERVSIAASKDQPFYDCMSVFDSCTLVTPNGSLTLPRKQSMYGSSTDFDYLDIRRLESPMLTESPQIRTPEASEDGAGIQEVCHNNSTQGEALPVEASEGPEPVTAVQTPLADTEIEDPLAGTIVTSQCEIPLEEWPIPERHTLLNKAMLESPPRVESPHIFKRIAAEDGDPPFEVIRCQAAQLETLMVRASDALPCVTSQESPLCPELDHHVAAGTLILSHCEVVALDEFQSAQLETFPSTDALQSVTGEETPLCPELDHHKAAGSIILSHCAMVALEDFQSAQLETFPSTDALQSVTGEQTALGPEREDHEAASTMFSSHYEMVPAAEWLIFEKESQTELEMVRLESPVRTGSLHNGETEVVDDGAATLENMYCQPMQMEPLLLETPITLQTQSNKVLKLESPFQNESPRPGETEEAAENGAPAQEVLELESPPQTESPHLEAEAVEIGTPSQEVIYRQPIMQDSPRAFANTAADSPISAQCQETEEDAHILPPPVSDQCRISAKQERLGDLAGNAVCLDFDGDTVCLDFEGNSYTPEDFPGDGQTVEWHIVAEEKSTNSERQSQSEVKSGLGFGPPAIIEPEAVDDGVVTEDRFDCQSAQQDALETLGANQSTVSLHTFASGELEDPVVAVGGSPIIDLKPKFDSNNINILRPECLLQTEAPQIGTSKVLEYGVSRQDVFNFSSQSEEAILFETPNLQVSKGVQTSPLGPVSEDARAAGPMVTSQWQMVAVGESTVNQEKPAAQFNKAVEALLAGAIRREDAAEEKVRRQAAEIEQLNRLIRQYKHERECNAILQQSREDKIARLESLMDGVLPSEAFLTHEWAALTNEYQMLLDKYDNHPEVTHSIIQQQRLIEELREYRDFFDLGEKEDMQNEIRQLRKQLQSFLDSGPPPRPLDSRRRSVLMQSISVRQSMALRQSMCLRNSVADPSALMMCPDPRRDGENIAKLSDDLTLVISEDLYPERKRASMLDEMRQLVAEQESEDDFVVPVEGGSLAITQTKNMDELEREWEERENDWMAVLEELRLEVDSYRRQAEMRTHELECERRCSEEVREALQMAMTGHARLLDQYAELQEKHISVLAKHRKIRDGAIDVKKMAKRAGVSQVDSRWLETQAAKIAVMEADHEEERQAMREEMESLRAQLNDTAEAVQAAGELLVRLREAEEAVCIAQDAALLAEQDADSLQRELEKTKRKHGTEIATLHQRLLESRLLKSTLCQMCVMAERVKFEFTEVDEETAQTEMEAEQRMEAGQRAAAEFRAAAACEEEDCFPKQREAEAESPARCGRSVDDWDYQSPVREYDPASESQYDYYLNDFERGWRG